MISLVLLVPVALAIFAVVMEKLETAVLDDPGHCDTVSVVGGGR